MMTTFEAGEYIVYRNGNRCEIGKVKSVTETGAFVHYTSGSTAAFTPYECMYKLINRSVIQKTNLGGRQNDE